MNFEVSSFLYLVIHNLLMWLPPTSLSATSSFIMEPLGTRCCTGIRPLMVELGALPLKSPYLSGEIERYPGVTTGMWSVHFYVPGRTKQRTVNLTQKEDRTGGIKKQFPNQISVQDEGEGDPWQTRPSSAGKEKYKKRIVRGDCEILGEAGQEVPKTMVSHQPTGIFKTQFYHLLTER